MPEVPAPPASGGPSAGEVFDAEWSLTALLRAAQRQARLPVEERRAGLPYAIQVAVLANHSSQFLALGLPLALAQRGIFASVYEAGYDQWQQELVDPGSGLARFQPDLVLISLSSCLLAFGASSGSPDELASGIAERILAARARSRAAFVLSLPEPLPEALDTAVWAHEWRRVLCQGLEQRLAASCLLVDLEPLIRRVGSSAWYSGQYLVTSKLPWHPDRSARHADYLARHIASLVARPIKLVVVDLDNTLWGGVVGEVGAENVDLDAQGAGLAHLRLQRFLLGLHAQGVLLAISSKNNPEDALAVFEKRVEMLLKLEHFAAVEIGWQGKSSILARILEQLNLSPTAVAFLDDNPLERGEIRHAFPGVHVPEWPNDPIDLVPALVESGRFLVVRSTSEDRERQAFYRVERQRQEKRAAARDLADYYRQLALVLTPLPVTADNTPRVLDLLAKTNQFNLTTRRHGRAALEQWLERPGAIVRAFRLADALGDYGIVGVLLAAPHGPDTLLIDTWLLSCRAMGRTVEDAMFLDLCSQARAQGTRRILGDYIPTKKNPPVAGLYPRLGFTPAEVLPEGGQRFELVLTDAPNTQSFVTLAAAP